MKKPVTIYQHHVSVDLPDNFENYIVLSFVEDSHRVSTHFIRYPKWWRFRDAKYQYNIFSRN